MLFHSFGYVLFLIIVFSLYWIIKDKYRWILLLTASYFFYMCSGLKYGLLILGLTVTTYFFAFAIERSAEGKKRKLILTATVVVCIGILFFFKYFNFFSSSYNILMKLFGINNDPLIINIVLPVGISFYTFQTMSYVIDVYRGDVSAELHLGKYAAFVSFFPQLVAGPIERTANLLPQIRRNHIFSYERALYGVKLMLWGYYKKIVIADGLSEYVKRVFDNPYDYSGFALVMATLFFTVQIYCDFSGYSDIAIGTAKLFDIELMVNFRSPYFSDSVKEFWQRWHISLSTWFRDYVYIPLGGNRVGNIRHYINLMVTFLVSGLWHGANWTFVAWGGCHGLVHIVESIVIGKKKADNPCIRFIRMMFVFAFCAFAWTFFVSNSMADAFYVIGHGMSGVTRPLEYIKAGFNQIGFGKSMMACFIPFIALLIIYDYIAYKKQDFIVWITEKSGLIQWTFYILVGLTVVFFSKKGVAADFIYFQF